MKYLPTTVVLTFVLVSAACTPYMPTATKSSVRDDGAERAWHAEGRRALRERLTIRPSFREIVRFSDERAVAVGYRLQLQRGQRVGITLEQRGSARINAEVFEEIGPGEPIFRMVHNTTTRGGSFSYEATTDGPHVLRIRPELHGAGEVIVTVTTAAALGFPVAGKTSRAIRSFFGDSRDGGRRDHEGIDIFATRGTPVLAVAPGVITAVQTTSIGGRVVWQHDPQRNVSYYYAHLNTQNVRRGDRVREGDVIGTVGNTGNARTTPPHLHFSVYRPGRVAIDPVPFLYDQPSDDVSPVLVDLEALGNLRAPRRRIELFSQPGSTGAALATVSDDQEVLLIGGVRDWYRVQLQDGRSGFVRAKDVMAASSMKGSR